MFTIERKYNNGGMVRWLVVRVCASRREAMIVKGSLKAGQYRLCFVPIKG